MGEEIRLTVPAQAAYARIARLATTGLAARMGFSYDEVEDLRIGIGEVCRVLLDGDGERLRFHYRVTDDAVEVDARSIPDGPVPIGGLTRQIVDAVFDAFTVDTQTGRIRAVKYRNPR